jgi:ribonucleoside-diphosphate reductase alpha chain
MKGPDQAIYRQDLTAIDQLKLWMTYQTHWCEHKPSVTISVKEEEWPKVGSWVWENFDSISGISFLPFSEHTYRQAPYQDCTKEEYNNVLKTIPQDIDWKELSQYEEVDYTVASQELACSADGGCEIVDL